MNQMKKRARKKRARRNTCEECGEKIALPVPREGGRIICEECFDEEKPRHYHSRESGEGADRKYHGGMFHSGEW